MKALTYQGRHDIRYGEAPDPAVTSPADAVVQVTAAGICGRGHLRRRRRRPDGQRPHRLVRLPPCPYPAR
ncbi:hypothetical protein [Streptomyces cahuitamycinicus]|uniref:hypothetical protein n=1 Tax=Streptomyces cahuitamycinicus TaxID=2070367 RepID=UPI001FEB26D9|nr:hypothetical protein [Streptomyces cahuitamycinicus]